MRPLPRWALWVLCAAYLLPGFLGRDPWKQHDIEAFGFMLQLARPDPAFASSWLHPALFGLPEPQLALLPTWLGAAFIQWSPLGWEVWAARWPFMGLLALALAATWHAAYALARSPSAQPVAFAFGGEARPKDYARTLADGAVLALLACLGLAQLSHEITATLSQLACSALLFAGLCSVQRHRWAGAAASATGMVGLTLSGAPTLALLLGAGGTAAVWLAAPVAQGRRMRSLDLGLLALAWLVCLTLAGALDLWRWRVATHATGDVRVVARLLLWFTWPAGPLALWALWRWRGHLQRVWQHVHLSLPMWFVGVTLCCTWLTGLTDRALLLSLPALAVLAAFALPTLRRSVGAFIDWFSLLFFSASALAIWVVWWSLDQGWPVQPARNVARAAPEFVHSFSPLHVGLAVLATGAWLALLRWRTGRYRNVLWKSLVLPAAGTSLCWLLLMTLWLPLLNHGRSYAPLVNKVRPHVGAVACVQVAGLNNAQKTALWVHGQLQVQALTEPTAQCPTLVVASSQLNTHLSADQRRQWREVARIKRPTDKDEIWVVLTAKAL